MRAFSCLWLLVVCVCLAGWASAESLVPGLPPTVSDGDLVGRPVVSVTVQVRGKLWTTPPAIGAPKPGAPLVLEVARAELRRLLDQGGFAEGSLTLEAVEGGVAVGFVLVPARYLRKVVVQGQVGNEDLVGAAGLHDVRLVTEASLETVRTRVRGHLVRKGYPNATVAVDTVAADKPLFVDVRLTVVGGAEATVDTRTFVGVPADAGSKAAAADYEVAVGDRADEDALELADAHLAQALRAAGFHGAAVSHVTALTSGKATVTITVVPGPRILVTFEGHTLFDREGLLAVLDLQQENDRSPARLAGKLEAAYVGRGKLDVRVEATLLGQVGDPVRTLRFRIREGATVTVVKRVYPCLTGALDAKRLDAEIDAFLAQAEAGNPGQVDAQAIDGALGKQDGVASGARPEPEVLAPGRTFVPEVYEKALDHLRELFRSEGYLSVEIGEASPTRATCDPKKSGPKTCVALPRVEPSKDKLCLFDANHLPLPVPAADPRWLCTPDPLQGRTCSSEVTVVIPINPGPRAYLWDVKVEGTKAFAPATLLASSGAIATLRMGQPLSLRDVDRARAELEAFYRDEGYAYASVKVTFEYSPDHSRARVRFLVVEGEVTLVDAIEIRGARHTGEALIRDRLLLREGAPYRAGLVRRSRERLLELGAFSTVSIELASPSIPGKRKVVVVTVVERIRLSVDSRWGFSLGEGFRLALDVQLRHLFGHAAELRFAGRINKQPFFGCTEGRPCALYDGDLIQRWSKLRGLESLPWRASLALSVPQSFGPVRTTIELGGLDDLRRDYQLQRWTSIVSFAAQPLPWLTAVLSGAIERNSFQRLGSDSVNALVLQNPALAQTLLVPEGLTAVFATGLTVTADFRDSKLGPTKNGFVSLAAEYVQSFYQGEGAKERQQLWHLVGAAGAYLRIPFLPGRSVLAFELRGGMNVDTGSCLGALPTECTTYPDRRFYLGGFESTRGIFAGQMMAQDVIDDLSASPRARLAAACDGPRTRDGYATAVAVPGMQEAACASLAEQATRGGNVFLNPRVELRIAAFAGGGFVLFVDAANSWLDRRRVQWWRLRTAVGPGLSVDTVIGPMAFDIGFNLNRYRSFDEPLAAFHFSIGRF